MASRFRKIMPGFWQPTQPMKLTKAQIRQIEADSLERQRAKFLRRESDSRGPRIAFGQERADMGQWSLQNAAWNDSARTMRRGDVSNAYYGERRERAEELE